MMNAFSRCRAHIRVQIGRWGPALVMMGVIFALSAVPSVAMPSLSGWLDVIVKKGGHLVAYGLLARFYLRGLGRETPGALSLAWLMSLLYGASDEFHQSFVPGRGASVVDVLIDAAGAGASLWLVGRRRQGASGASGLKSAPSSQSSDGTSSISPKRPS